MARTLLPDDSGENDGLSGRRSPLAQTPKRLPVPASDGLSGRPKERSGERLSQVGSGLDAGRTLRRRSPEPTRGKVPLENQNGTIGTKGKTRAIGRTGMIDRSAGIAVTGPWNYGCSGFADFSRSAGSPDFSEDSGELFRIAISSDVRGVKRSERE